MFVFLNGEFVPESEAVVSVNDRGFLLGDGLFETVRVVNGRAFRVAQHLERLTAGADFLKIKLPFLPNELEQDAARLIERNQMPESILRVTLTRGSSARGYSPKGADVPTLVLSLHPAPPRELSRNWSLVTSSYRIPAGDTLASFKTTSKILHVMARDEAEEKGADEALLVNTNGEVAETAGGNIFWVYQGQICTVPAGRGVLPGVTRAVTLEICRSLGLPASERIVKPDALGHAAGIFVTQSALGIVPVASLDGGPVAVSPLVARLAGAYNDLLARESARSRTLD